MNKNDLAYKNKELGIEIYIKDLDNIGSMPLPSMLIEIGTYHIEDELNMIKYKKDKIKILNAIIKDFKIIKYKIQNEKP